MRVVLVVKLPWKLLFSTVHTQTKISLGNIANIPDGLANISIRTKRPSVLDLCPLAYMATENLSFALATLKGSVTKINDVKTSHIGDTLGLNARPYGLMTLLRRASTVTDTSG